VFEIGSSLREARERQGLDLAAVERETKIRGKYIRALEDEQFELLPAQTYVKGFLRTYAEVLGLDGQLYVDEYNSRFVAGDDDTHFRPRRSAARQPQERNRRLESVVVLVALAAIAILTVVVIGAWTSSDKHATSQTTPKTSKKVHATRPTVPARGVLLVISAPHGNSLLEVHARTATGPLRFQGTILRRQVPLKFWAKQLWVNVGTPENLTFTVNGRPVTVPGGSPRVLVFTRHGVRSGGAT
jgi:cytoskeletal protein RodZ